MSTRLSRRNGVFGRHCRLESLEDRCLLAVVTIPAVADATLYERSDGSLANGSGQYLFAGRTGQPEGLSIRRALVRFDVAGNLPLDAAINDVQLVMNMSRSTAGPEVVSLHRVRNPWQEGASDPPREEGTGAPAGPGDVTWIHRDFPAPLWDTPGGDFQSSASGATTVAGVGRYTWSTPGMIDDVQDWLDLPETNFGWLLMGNESRGRTAKRFDSSENPDRDNRPMLIIDFEGAASPIVTVAAAENVEGDEGLTTLAFPVTISQNPTSPVTVSYTTVPDTATVDEDYVATSGQLVFAPGDPLTKTISVFVHGDRTFEDDETFLLSVSDVAGGELSGPDQVAGTIINDDPLPIIEFDDQSVDETDVGSTVVDLEIRLSNPSENEISVDYVLQGDTATADEDFVSASGRVVFLPGEDTQTVAVEVLGDTLVEGDEAVRVLFQNAQNAVLAREALQLTIVDNDQPREHPWRNPDLVEDVNGDGLIVPLDALLVINRLNTIGAGPLPVPPTPEDSPPPFFDVNGDDFVSPIDALLVINFLNSQSLRAGASVDRLFAGSDLSALAAALDDD